MSTPRLYPIIAHSRLLTLLLQDSVVDYRRPGLICLFSSPDNSVCMTFCVSEYYIHPCTCFILNSTLRASQLQEILWFQSNVAHFGHWCDKWRLSERGRGSELFRCEWMPTFYHRFSHWKDCVNTDLKFSAPLPRPCTYVHARAFSSLQFGVADAQWNAWEEEEKTFACASFASANIPALLWLQLSPESSWREDKDNFRVTRREALMWDPA